MKSQNEKHKPLYRCTRLFQIRTPMLPIQFASCDLQQAIANPLVEAAIGIASPSLYERYKKEAHSGSEDPTIGRKLKKYLRRMSTRPTPFGLFSGVSVGRFGEKTEISRGSEIKLKISPDLAWLNDIFRRIEKDKLARKSLFYVPNPEIIIKDKRAWTTVNNSDGSQSFFSVRITPVVEEALSICRLRPSSFDEICDKLTERFAAPLEKSTNVCEQLIDNSILISDLRFSPNLQNPLDYVLELFNRNSSPPPIIAALFDLQDKIAQVDHSTSIFAEQYFDLVAEAPALPGTKDLFRIDTKTNFVKDKLSNRVADEISRFAEALLALSPGKNADLELYAEAFQNRYQLGRVVPLLELASEVFGLGSPYLEKYSKTQFGYGNHERDRFLMDLLSKSIQEKCPIIDLTDEQFNRLSRSQIDVELAPLSIDMFVKIEASSQAEIDAGNFKLFLGPSGALRNGGRAIGRFKNIFGNDVGFMLSEIHEEEKRHANGGILADLVFWPTHDAALNVAQAATISELHISVGPFGAAQGKNIPLDEIVIGLDGEKFFAEWKRTGQHIIARSRNVVNPNLIPPIARFLIDIEKQNCDELVHFDWGSAALLPFLPRLQFKKFILSPARWHIQPELAQSSDFEQTLERLRIQYGIPDDVVVSNSLGDDHELLINLTKSSDVEMLKDVFTKSIRLNEGFVLQEYIPIHLWHETTEGNFCTEFVTSVVKTNTSHISKSFPAATVLSKIPQKVLSCAPGSDWIYLRLDCAKAFHEDIIVQVANLVKPLKNRGILKKWFFVRFSDDTDHLRLRFKIEQTKLYSEVLPLLCDWASRLLTSSMCSSYSLETYEREVERYGGPISLDLVESIFCIESEVIAQFFESKDDHDPVLVAALFIKTILSCFTQKDGLFQQSLIGDLDKSQVSHLNSEVLHRKETLRLLLKEERDSVVLEKYLMIYEYCNTLKALIAPVATELFALEKKNSLTERLEHICQSMVHMHCNKIFGIDREAELLTRILLSKVASIRHPTYLADLKLAP